MGELLDPAQPPTGAANIVETVGGAVALKEIAIEEIDVEALWTKGDFSQAVDVLTERKQLEQIRLHPLDRLDAGRLVLYMQSVASLTPQPQERTMLLDVAYDLAVSHGDVVTAMHIALLLHDLPRVYELFDLCASATATPADARMMPVLESNSWPESARLTYAPSGDTETETNFRKLMRVQLAYVLSRHTLRIDEDRILGSILDDESQTETLKRIFRREYIAPLFEYLATELEVLEPRLPEDIYKSALEENKKRIRSGTGMEPNRAALASAYVSAFVHAGFCKDGLLLQEGSQHINKTRQHGVSGATAGIGLICLWNVEEGLALIDKFQYSNEPHTKSGALLAFGLSTVNVANDCDPVLTLVADALKSSNAHERLSAATALAYAYVGTARQDISELLVPILVDLETLGGLEASACAALGLGMTFVGTGDESIAEALVQTLMERVEIPGALDSVHVCNFALALALLFLEKREAADAVLSGLAVVNHPVAQFAKVLTEGAAWAGSGDVLKIQQMIEACLHATEEASKEEEEEPADFAGSAKDNVSTAAQPSEESPSSDGGKLPGKGAGGDGASKAIAKQVKEQIQTSIPAVCVLAICLISIKDDIGSEMVFRLLHHLLQFDGLFVRRAIPIAMALLYASNPKPNVVDTISRLSHDIDGNTQLNAIVALGVVSAGTNNARVAQLLRSLSTYFADQNAIFLVRLSQGLLYSSKGLVSLSPLHADRTLINQGSLAGLLSFCVQAIFTEHTLCQGRYHLNFFHLVPAIHPRWLITVDEELKPVAVQVRVGQALDVAGLAGQPKKVTGFRTHNTPVLLAYNEKAQMGSDEWHPLSAALEGVVVVRRLAGKEKSLAGKALE